VKSRLPLILGVLLLLLSLVLAARGAEPVGATGAPHFTVPQTAHLQFDGAMRVSDRDSASAMAITASGQGDYDQARQAAQLQAEIVSQGTEAGVPQTERVAVAVVMVDGKLYWRDPLLGTWTWTAATAAQSGQTPLSPDTLGLTGFDGLNFVALRKEALNGAITTHWHADLDLAALLTAEGGAVPSDPAMPLPQLTAAVDLWIGDADGYLHRMDFAMAMTVADGAGPALALEATYALTLSNFDQPTTIVAPDGATPASTDPTSAAPASALAGVLPAGVGSSLSALPLGAGGSAFPGLGGLGGANVTGIGGQPAPSSRPAAGANAVKPTATSVPRPSPKASAPTATVALAANVATGNGNAPGSAAPVAGALEAAPTVLAANDGNRTFLFTVGIGVLLVAALGLLTFGWRMSRR
jgi:hypothetical protein